MEKKTTIYDLAKVMNISPSYISKALNDHPSVSAAMREKVKKIASELNYKHNTYAANLRKGISKTIGVIVPHINKSFFSDIIAGVEEVCFEHDYGLIICQSQESFDKECRAIDTLTKQNVDALIISVSAETKSSEHLNKCINSMNTILIDRDLNDFDGYKIINDNEEIGYKATAYLLHQGYKNIVYLGWISGLTINEQRKRGFMKALADHNLQGRYFDGIIERSHISDVVTQLLTSDNAPDAFFTFSDFQGLCILQVANSLGINVPNQLGILGTGNDSLTEISKTTLSAIDQNSIEMGKCAANLYFNIVDQKQNGKILATKQKIIPIKIVPRESTALKITSII